MKISQLEQILEVANVGSISQAAVNLYMSQPNLSLSIKNIENEMGIQIFQRTSTGVRLTHEGWEFVERAKEILLQIDALEAACSVRQNRTVPLELCIASMTYRILNIEVAKILRRYDRNLLKVDMINAVGTKLLDMVAEDRAEVGFCTVYEFSKKIMMRQIAMRRLEYHTIGQAVTGIYVGKNNTRFTNDTVVDFEKLRQLPVIVIAKREFNAQTVADHLITECGINFEFQNTIQVSNFGELRSMVNLIDSFAIAAYLDVDYEPYGFYDDLRFIPFAPGLLSAEFGCIQKENTVRGQLVNELLTGLKNAFTYR